jgi:hypothetical protein
LMPANGEEAVLFLAKSHATGMRANESWEKENMPIKSPSNCNRPARAFGLEMPDA